jgi:hypothetical protein
VEDTAVPSTHMPVSTSLTWNTHVTFAVGRHAVVVDVLVDVLVEVLVDVVVLVLVLVLVDVLVDVVVLVLVLVLVDVLVEVMHVLAGTALRKYALREQPAAHMVS